MKLGNQIDEVAQLFKEIAVLVESQSEVVDSIEQNVLKAEDQIKDGTKQLGQAEENKKSSRKKKVVCFSIIAVVIIIIVSVLIISVEWSTLDSGINVGVRLLIFEKFWRQKKFKNDRNA